MIMMINWLALHLQLQVLPGAPGSPALPLIPTPASPLSPLAPLAPGSPTESSRLMLSWDPNSSLRSAYVSVHF